jgi:hypothetical protein
MSPEAAESAFNWARSGRSLKTAMGVICLWVLMLIACVQFEASPWLLAIIGLFTLPALHDLLINPKAGVRLDAATLHWFSGRRAASVNLTEIDHVRLDTRMDFSVRATVVTHAGRKIRLPFESTPPPQKFDEALRRRGITTRRHHFSPIG